MGEEEECQKWREEGCQNQKGGGMRRSKEEKCRKQEGGGIPKMEGREMLKDGGRRNVQK